MGVLLVARACCSDHSIRFVSISQSWPLSQDANKSSGTCSVCLATRQLHLRDGTIHRHGPRSAPCSGSNKLPLDVVRQPLAASASPSLSATDESFTSSPLSGTCMGSCGIWSPADCPLIKHIPMSARSACTSHLSSILRSVSSQPESESSWLDLFDWGDSILQPQRSGKRHNLASTVKKRISAYSAGKSRNEERETASVQRQKQSAADLLSKVVRAKIQDGNVKGGVRPIAIGFSLRHLAPKCANQLGSNRLKSYFHPHEVGVGIPGGCEAVIHSAGRF